MLTDINPAYIMLVNAHLHNLLLLSADLEEYKDNLGPNNKPTKAGLGYIDRLKAVVIIAIPVLIVIVILIVAGR